MSSTADVLVVGLGAVGSATLYQCAKAGARAIGIDRFRPPHDQGSSHGETRIMRQAIGEGREFVPLVLRSNEIWQELEAASGRDLLTRNGVLILASTGTSGDHHGSKSFLQDTIDIAGEFGIAHEVLNSSEIGRRFPQFRPGTDEAGYFEPGAGFLRPESCIEAQIVAAQECGATVNFREMVLGIQPGPGAVEVFTDIQAYVASQVVITAGPWIGKLLGDGVREHFNVYRQVLHWFSIARNAEQYAPERFPVFIWITGSSADDMMYGFPAVDGPAGGVKIATERYDQTVDPDEVSRDVSAPEIRDLYQHYMAQRLPDISPQCLRSTTCLYTVAPDARFVIDHALDSDRVRFASACSGHGFKHSAALGEALADVALGREPRVDLSPFRMEQLPGVGR